MRHYILLSLMLFSLTSFAQINEQIYGNWIKTEVSYKDGRELTDDNTLKYEYLKYSFIKPDKAFLALAYNSKDKYLSFSIASNILQIKNSTGFIMNELVVEKLTANELVLIQPGVDGADSPDALRYHYITEKAYQDSIPLTGNDIVSVTGSDTIYRASEKIYAEYKGETGFHELAYKALGGLHDQTHLSNHFLATFIVNKDGVADSLRIIEGLNPEYDKKFTETFNKLSHNWAPARYNGKAVCVQMKDETKFIAHEKYPLYDRYSKAADEAMNQGNYPLALIDYSKALNYDSYSGEIQYKKALCHFLTGDNAAACEDLQKAKDLDYSAATGLMKKLCH